MAAIIATIISIFSMLNGAITFFKSIFGGKSSTGSDAVATGVAVENKTDEVTAQATRSAENAVSKEIQDASLKTDASVAAVRNASSVRDQQSAIDAAINGANAPTSSDR
jgi:hypothetical protein